MTGPIWTGILTLLAAVGLDRQQDDGLPPDTPPSDLVILRYPYAVAKDSTKGSTAPTELIELNNCHLWNCGFHFDWVYFDGLPRPTLNPDAHQTAVVGSWLVVKDRQGQCYTFDMAGAGDSSPSTNLDGVNDHLARHGVGPLTDTDFRTFEELMAERERRRVTWSLVGLAVGVAPLAVAVVVMFVRRRGSG
jgi:hypothetical protein